MDLNFIILTLPLIFMFHDFEEIIFFKTWLKRNKNHLLLRFPFISPRVIHHFEKLKVATFAFAVAEEFVLLSIISITAVIYKFYGLWFGVFIAFYIHIFGHIVQWIIYRRYIPAIVTSLLVFPFGVYCFLKWQTFNVLPLLDELIWALIGITIMIVNLFFIHKIMPMFQAYLNKE